MSFLSKLFNPNNRKLKELRLEAVQLQKELGSKPSVVALEKLATVLAELVKLEDIEAHLVLAVTYFNLIKARLGWKEPEPWLIIALPPDERSKVFLDATGGLMMIDGLLKSGGKPKNEVGQRQLEQLRQSLQQAASASRKPLEASPKEITVSSPQASEDEIKYKEAMRVYWKYQAVKWWEANPDRQSDAVCDVCNSPISPLNSFYFVIGRRMKCEACTERSLNDWEGSKYSKTYFGHNEFAVAMEHYATVTPPPKD